MQLDSQIPYLWTCRIVFSSEKKVYFGLFGILVLYNTANFNLPSLYIAAVKPAHVLWLSLLTGPRAYCSQTTPVRPTALYDLGCLSPADQQARAIVCPVAVKLTHFPTPKNVYLLLSKHHGTPKIDSLAHFVGIRCGCLLLWFLKIEQLTHFWHTFPTW